MNHVSLSAPPPRAAGASVLEAGGGGERCPAGEGPRAVPSSGAVERSQPIPRCPEQGQTAILPYCQSMEREGKVEVEWEGSVSPTFVCR